MLLVLFQLGAAVAGVSREIEFAPGSSGTVIKGAVIRGERDRYTLKALAGQTMRVSITSLENNAVFQVRTLGGKRLSKQEAVTWRGRLPASGTYVIEVGGTRGNASYTLTVSIP